MDDKKLENLLKSNATFISRDTFGYIVDRNDFFSNIPLKEVCGSMPILSSHNKCVMYIPLYHVYPMQIKKMTFFPTHMNNNITKKPAQPQRNKKQLQQQQLLQQQDLVKEISYECEPFISYAILIGKTPFTKEYNNIYSSVYSNVSTTDILDKLEKSDSTCGGGDDEFKNEYLKNDDEDAIDFLEDVLTDDQIFIMYMTETRLLYHGHTSKPLIFNKNFTEIIDEPENHIPYTEAIALYSSPLITTTTTQQQDSLISLRCSFIILQDMIEFIAASVSLPDTFTTLQEVCSFMYSIKTKNYDTTDDESYQLNGNKIALRLRMDQDCVADASYPSSISSDTFKIGSDAICIHTKFINMCVGHKTAMNCYFPVATKSGDRFVCKINDLGIGVYQGLKTTTLFESKTFTLFVCSLMYMVLQETNPIKFLTFQKKTCPTCLSSICCKALCNSYCRTFIQKELSISNSYLQGVGYTCIAEYNQATSFIGNAKSESMKEEDLAKDVANLWLPAAEEFNKKFSHFKVTEKAQIPRLREMLNYISKIADCIDNDEHELPYRIDRQTKLEMEVKEILKPSNGYIGTYNMAIRKSGIYRLCFLLTMMSDKDILNSQYNRYNCILTGHFHGSYHQTTNVNKSIVSDKLVLEGEKDAIGQINPVTGHPIQTSVKLSTIIATKSTNKLKCSAGYLIPPDHQQQSTSSTLSYGNATVSADIIEKSKIWLIFAALPSLERLLLESNASLTVASPVKKEKVLTKFLKDNSAITAVLGTMDYNTLSITNWDQFKELFIIHKMLNKYGYQPVIYNTYKSGGDDDSTNRSYKLGNR